MLQPVVDSTYQIDQQQYQTCDNISSTNNCISTPFSVKDILNMPSEEYITNDTYIVGQTKEQYLFDDGFHHWDQNVPYQGYEATYYYNEQLNNNCVKNENYDEFHIMPSHVQELSNFCIPYSEEKQIIVESTTEIDNSSKNI